MELQHQTRSKGAQNLKHLLFDHSLPAGADLRGFVVYDRSHKRIGTIGEVYCDYMTLKPRYVEIIPLHSGTEKTVLYPYEYVDWRGNDGPAFISSSLSSILAFEEYDFNHVMECEGHELVTFNEAIGLKPDEQSVQPHFPLCA